MCCARTARSVRRTLSDPAQQLLSVMRDRKRGRSTRERPVGRGRPLRPLCAGELRPKRAQASDPAQQLLRELRPGKLCNARASVQCRPDVLRPLRDDKLGRGPRDRLVTGLKLRMLRAATSSEHEPLNGGATVASRGAGGQDRAASTARTRGAELGASPSLWSPGCHCE